MAKKEIIKEFEIKFTFDGKEGTIETPVKVTDKEYKMLKGIGERYFFDKEDPDNVKEPTKTIDGLDALMLGEDVDIDDDDDNDDSDVPAFEKEDAVADWHTLCNMYRAIIKNYMDKTNIDEEAFKATIRMMLSVFDPKFLASELTDKED